MTGDLEPSRCRQRKMLSNFDQDSSVCQSWVYQEQPPYPVRTPSGWNRKVKFNVNPFPSATCPQCCQFCRRPLYLSSHDQSAERGVKETEAAVTKRSNKNGGKPHNASAAAALTDNPTAKQSKKHKHRSPAHIRRSQLRAEEYRKELESLQSSLTNCEQDTPPVKETRDSYTQTLSSTLATHKDSTGVKEQTESMVAHEGIDDHHRMIHLGEKKLLMATLSQILRHLSSSEDIRWPHPDAVTRSILTCSNILAADFMAPEAVVEKVIEACNKELKLDLHSEEAACANGRADSRPFMKHCTENFSFAVNDIFIIFILIVVAVVYLEPTVM